MPKQRDVKQEGTQNLSKGVDDPEVLYNLCSLLDGIIKGKSKGIP
jgi:hypothetical protein